MNVVPGNELAETVLCLSERRNGRIECSQIIKPLCIDDSLCRHGRALRDYLGLGLMANIRQILICAKGPGLTY